MDCSLVIANSLIHMNMQEHWNFLEVVLLLEYIYKQILFQFFYIKNVLHLLYTLYNIYIYIYIYICIKHAFRLHTAQQARQNTNAVASL